jgi:hypothetical protein
VSFVHSRCRVTDSPSSEGLIGKRGAGRSKYAHRKERYVGANKAVLMALGIMGLILIGYRQART